MITTYKNNKTNNTMNNNSTNQDTEKSVVNSFNDMCIYLYNVLTCYIANRIKHNGTLRKISDSVVSELIGVDEIEPTTTDFGFTGIDIVDMDELNKTVNMRIALKSTGLTALYMNAIAKLKVDVNLEFHLYAISINDGCLILSYILDNN